MLNARAPDLSFCLVDIGLNLLESFSHRLGFLSSCGAESKLVSLPQLMTGKQKQVGRSIKTKTFSNSMDAITDETEHAGTFHPRDKWCGLLTELIGKKYCYRRGHGTKGKRLKVYQFHQVVRSFSKPPDRKGGYGDKRKCGASQHKV